MTNYTVVPCTAIPDQTVQIYIAGQNVTLRVYQRTFGLFVDFYLNKNPILYGVKAFNLNLLLRDKYFGIAGDFIFFDTQGEEDPDYTGLGGRFVLLYGDDLS
jgi:hypothetical protein